MLISTPTYPYEVRDPIHGFVHLTEQEWQLLSTQPFQRLRRIHQLALTYLVYPGSTHTRFEHSLGTMYVAGRLADRLKLSPGKKTLVRQATLLHDIGHGPFSHVSENLLDHYSGESGTHEKISAWIVESDEEVRSVIGDSQAHEIALLLRREGLRSVMRDIISSRTDADKLDYLLRDSHACGVKYGVFDADRLIETAVVLKSGEESQLGFDRDSVWALEGLLLARHHMHRQVYGHRTRLVTDAMLVRSMELAVEGGILDKAAFTFKKAKAFLRKFLDMDDYEVQRRILASTGKARDMMSRLRERRLLKRVYHEVLTDLYNRAGFNWDIIDFLISPRRFDRGQVRSIESSVGEELGIPPHEVVVSLETQENPTYRTPGYPTSEADIILYDRTARRTVPFFQASDIFQGSLTPRRQYLSLYVSTDGLTPQQRRRLEQHAERAITQALRGIER